MTMTLAVALVLMLAACAAGSGPASRVPEPKPASTGRLLVGAIACPIWRQSPQRKAWNALEAYPERTPLLGYYDEGDPEVTDWEVKWALEHGIGLFVSCWYRAPETLGKPARPIFGHWLHDGLFKSRAGGRIQFAILWENANSVACGVQSEQDLLENLLPFWIENYFRRPNYLREQGKPVLFIYRPEKLIADLGGPEPARAAIDAMRAACRKAGLKGLIVAGEHHGENTGSGAEATAAMARLGMDYSYSYHWPTFTRHMPPPDGRTQEALVQAQEACWRESAAGPLPHIVTASTGWDSRPWGGAFSKAAWSLQPPALEQLCLRARAFAAGGTGLARRLVLLDNWNEFGEGHYLLPTRSAGFGPLDAVRRAFAPRAGAHQDTQPADLGLGPYDALYRAHR